MTTLSFNAAGNPENPDRHTLFWALVLSIALHLVIASLPRLHLKTPKQPDILTVELAQPTKAAAVAAPQPVPEEPKPAAEPKALPKPVAREIPSPVKINSEPPPVSAPAEVAQPTPPTVMTNQPKADAEPVYTVPPSPPEPTPTAPSQIDLDAARSLYGSLLTQAIARQKQYPRVAQTRGWEGDIQLDLQLDGNGNVLSSSIHKGSNYEALNKEALEMVKRASPFPLPPAALRGHTFNILVSVSFKLEPN